MRRTPLPIREAALALLARRDHASAELRRKLHARGYPRDDIDALIRDLTARGLLDDHRVARLLIEHDVRAGRGTGVIRARLLAKGIAPDVADECLAALGEEWEGAQARRVAQRWLARHGTQGSWREALARHLRTRGFGWDQVRLALGSLGDDEWRFTSDDES